VRCYVCCRRGFSRATKLRSRYPGRQQQATPRYDFESLEGFLAAQLLTEALEKAGADPSRQALKEGFESLGQLDLGGFKVSLGPRDHQASDFVDLSFTGSQHWGP
jgi:ABC-type branched-subunit amino acid transport system substrate-binding protein